MNWSLNWVRVAVKQRVASLYNNVGPCDYSSSKAGFLSIVVLRSYTKEKNGFSQLSYSDWKHWVWIRRCNCETFLFEEPRTQSDDILTFTRRENETSIPFQRGIGMQGLPRSITRRVMGGIGFFSASIETITCSAAWKKFLRMCKNVQVFLYDLILFIRSLLGMFLGQIGVDWSITLEKSSLSIFAILPVVTMTRFILWPTFELLNFSHLLSFHRFVTFATICAIRPPPISSFSYRRFFIRLNCSISPQSTKMILLGHFWLPFPSPLRCSAGSSFVLDGCQRTFLKNLLSTSSSSDL